MEYNDELELWEILGTAISIMELQMQTCYYIEGIDTQKEWNHTKRKFLIKFRVTTEPKKITNTMVWVIMEGIVSSHFDQGTPDANVL